MQVFSQNPSSPYRLQWATDGLILSSSLAVGIPAVRLDGRIPALSAGEIATLNKNDINPIDRITAGWYSPVQSDVSDLLVGGLIVSPGLLLFDRSVREDLGTIAVMYLETALLSHALSSLAKGEFKRTRPSVYGLEMPLSEKLSSDVRRSFFSGHATWAFSSGVFFATVFSEYYRKSSYLDYVWGGTLGLATTVSVLRVTSGAHFMSDVVAGAFVGSMIGYGIPYLHRQQSDQYSLLPFANPISSGLVFTIRL